MALSKQTLIKIYEDPEAFARQMLDLVGTDNLEDFIDSLWQAWDKEGSHK